MTARPFIRRPWLFIALAGAALVALAACETRPEPAPLGTCYASLGDRACRGAGWWREA